MTVVTVEDLIRCLERLQARGPIPFDVKSGEVFGILCTCGKGRRILTAILMTTIFPVPIDLVKPFLRKITEAEEGRS